MSKTLAWLNRELRKLAEEEEGASLVFATITLFAVSMSIVFVYQMGLVSTDRLTVQNAADAAAYSAAQVEANSLNSIAQINDGMTYLNYVMLRYTIDAVVYSTMHEYKNHSRPAAPDWVLMGSSGGDEGVKRYDHIKEILQSNNAYDKGLKWMNELHYAGRMIMASTPRLAREVAADVAGQNGASYVAFSEDLDKAFNVGDGDSEGFSEVAYSNDDDEFNLPMYDRYGTGKRQVPHAKQAGQAPSAEERKLPLRNGRGAVKWFDSTTGKTEGEYYQVRLCWNKKDWGHPGRTPHLAMPYGQFALTPKGPNAHWHERHKHKYIDFSGTFPTIKYTKEHGDTPEGDTKGGHYMLGGAGDDDPEVHHPANGIVIELDGLHHRPARCPTCDKNSQDAPQPNGARSRKAEIKKRSKSASTHTDKFNLDYKSKNGVFPRPLFMKEALLRSGITVAAWRPGRGIGDLFPKSEWGMIAVASAQVGLQESDKVLPLKQLSGGTATYAGTGANNSTQKQIPYAANRNGRDDKFANLFYAKQNGEGGVRFGARLVPIARENTWHKDLYSSGKGLKAILEDQPSGSAKVWYKADRNASAGSPPDIGKLKQFVTVRSDQGLKAFWH